MSTVGSYRGPNIITRGLVLHLDAASPNSYYSPNGGTVWKDVSGNGNDGTLVNGTTFSDDAFDFDGSNDYAEGPVIEPSRFTLSAWFKPTGPPFNNDQAGGFVICNSPQLPNSAVQYAIAYSWTNTRVVLWTQENTNYLTAGGIPQDTWVNVVGTYDGSLQTIYINGSQSSQRSWTRDPIYPTSGNRNVQIGRWGFGSYQRNFNGNIETASIYNRALSAQEVLQNYNATKDRFGL